MSPPLQITEDTPPDMLAGSMDLCVMLPNGHTVKMSVERSTPMMDLLVQVTTANKISPAGHTIQALGERGVMPYKPSTPIGALDTWTIHIVPKNQVGLAANRKAPLKTVNQPFEQTFRLQVHLPRNQLFVTRISPKTKLSDILNQVCSEKNLDSSKYSLRHPVNLDQVLNLSYCLADYKLTEVALVSNRSWPLGVSSVDIMSLQQNDNAGYNYNMSRNSRSCEGSMSSGSIGGRSLSPTRSDGSSASPPPVVPPNRPLRKRRPAPKPPVHINNNNNINNSNNNNNNNNIDNNSNKCEQQQSSSQVSQNTVICHSRNSSDSSGYHEASVLSESPESNSLPDSLPRRSKLPSASIAESNSSKVASNLSRSLSNLTTVGNSGIPSMKSHSVSSTSLVSITGRKKKAAPPPPALISRMSSVSEEIPKQRTPSVSSNASSSATLEDNDHNLLRKSSTLPASIRVAQPSSDPEPTIPEISPNSSVVSEPPCSSLDRLHDAPELEAEEEKKVDPASELRLDDDEIDRIFHNATRDHASLESGVGDEPPLSLLSLPSPPSSLTNQPESSVNNNNAEALDWEYQLPAPPTFRDETNSPTVTEFDTVTIGNLTEVFGPESIAELRNKKQLIKNEPDILNSQVINENKITRDTPDAVSQIKENNKLVISKNIENKNQESKTSRMNEQPINKGTAVARGSVESDCIKPDLLKHSNIEEETTTSPDIEKSAVMCELSSVINDRLVRPEVNVNDIENSIKSRNSSDVQQSCTLDNFVITTYKETKPIEVFEDDSIKSSNGERRDSSRDEAMFRAPKSIPRRFEPNLARRSSFNSSDKPVNISVKRSVSHVSLLAGNVSRGPYRSHLARSNGALTETVQLPEETKSTGSCLRKTTSELNISQGTGDSKIADWRTGDTVGLQSLQVLRSILPQIRNSQSCVDSVGASEVDVKQERVAPVSNKKFERTLSEQTEEVPSKEPSVAKRYSYSGPPSVNLTTWSERPKRQVSIKMDRDYCSGFGKLKANSLDETKTKDSTKSNELSNGYSSTLVQQSHSKIDEKLDIVKHSNDISRVPIVRAVELKKPFSSSNVDVSDLSRCGYFNGRSYENLNCVDKDFKPHTFNKYHEPVLQSSCKSGVSVGSKAHPSGSASNVKFNTQQADEERSSVTSLAKRFGEPKPRPNSCYLFNTQEKQTDRNDDYCVKSGNTSRVFLNASDNKKFTSIVGINGLDNSNHSSNVRSNKTEIKIVQKPQFQSSKVMIGVKNGDDNTVGFKINGNIYSSKADNSSASDVRSQAKISSGGYLEDAGNKVPAYGNRISHNTSLRHNSNVMPVVKGFRKVENKTSNNEPINSGGIPPPPPVLPILKPVSERKQIKTLPPLQADPRDQLLESIRGFGGMNSLKKVALK